MTIAGTGQRQWWQRPSLRTDEEFDHHRPVGWLELFFDLVFVVVIARLAHYLGVHLDGRGVLEFVLQFVGVFWAWNGFTYYTERFESEGLENRLVTFLAIVPVAGLAVWGEGGLGEHYTGFAIAYLLARGVNQATWVRAGLHNPLFRSIAARFVAGYSLVAVLVLAGLTTSGDLRLVLWALAMAADIATPYFTMRQQSALPRLSTSKFPERFGLFTMIVLGESVVGVITGLSELNEAGVLGPLGVAQGIVGLGIGFAIWWIYFDFIARRPPKPVITAALAWVYLHGAAVTAITMTGVGISVVIADGAQGAPGDAGRHLLVAGAVLGLVTVALLETTLAQADDEPTHARVSPGLKLLSAALVALALVDLGGHRCHCCCSSWPWRLFPAGTEPGFGTPGIWVHTRPRESRPLLDVGGQRTPLLPSRPPSPTRHEPGGQVSEVRQRTGRRRQTPAAPWTGEGIRLARSEPSLRR